MAVYTFINGVRKRIFSNKPCVWLSRPDTVLIEVNDTRGNPSTLEYFDEVENIYAFNSINSGLQAYGTSKNPEIDDYLLFGVPYQIDGNAENKIHANNKWFDRDSSKDIGTWFAWSEVNGGDNVALTTSENPTYPNYAIVTSNSVFQVYVYRILDKQTTYVKEKHTIGKCYTFINGTRKQIFDTWSLKNEQLFLSDTNLSIPFGTYQVVLRGAGGAGGEQGANTGGLGGAGAKGELQVVETNFDTTTTIGIHIGTGGLTYANGGNGGVGGSGGANYDGGAGGGGGQPSYIVINNEYTFANGGGGGGGGGASARYGRYGQGASGGGGGGYYRVELDNTITSVAGKTGANGGGNDDGNGRAGTAGNTTDFPDLVSGAGAGGNGGSGGANASGGGASGGGGGAGSGNHSSAYGGGAGGGAGGSADAGGGFGGSGRWSGGNGSNAHDTPTDTITENNSYGVNANYGIGGTTNTNGSQGFVLVKRIA